MCSGCRLSIAFCLYDSFTVSFVCFAHDGAVFLWELLGGFGWDLEEFVLTLIKISAIIGA